MMGIATPPLSPESPHCKVSNGRPLSWKSLGGLAEAYAQGAMHLCAHASPKLSRMPVRVSVPMPCRRSERMEPEQRMECRDRKGRGRQGPRLLQEAGETRAEASHRWVHDCPLLFHQATSMLYCGEGVFSCVLLIPILLGEG